VEYFTKQKKIVADATNGRSSTTIGKKMGTSGATIDRARRILKRGKPELIDRVILNKKKKGCPRPGLPLQ
jgi:uncharacterized protein YerC